MSLRDEIEADFGEVLGEAPSASLTFEASGLAAQRVRAAVSETTFASDLEGGGFRARRSFSATARLSDFSQGVPKPGTLVRYSGKSYRVTNAKASAENPLVEIEFGEG